MRNFSDAQKALQTAYNSTNSAMEENSRFMESITAKQNALNAEYQKFVLGDGGLEALEKKLLDVGIAFMKFINDIGGLSTVLSAFGTLVATLAASKIPALVTSMGGLVTTATNLISNFITARQSGMSFSMALESIGVSASIAQIGIQGLVAIIGIAITLFTAYQQKQKQIAEETHKANQEVINQANIIDEQLKNLQKENKSRSELIKAIQAVDGAYKDEGQSLDEINKKRQESIDKLKEEEEAALRNAKNAGLGQYQKDLGILGSGYQKYQTPALIGDARSQYLTKASAAGITFGGGDSEAYLEYLRKIQEHYTSLGESNKKLNADIRNLESEIQAAKQATQDYEDVLYKLNLKYDEASGRVTEMTAKEVEEKEKAEAALETKEKTIGILDELGASIDEITDKLSDEDLDKFQDLLIAGDLEGIVALLEQYGIEVEKSAENTEEASSALNDFMSTAEDLQGAYETLSKAADDYNKYGAISASTLKKLSELQPEYINQLEIVNGKMQVSNGLLQENFEHEKQLAIIAIKTAKQIRIQGVCQEYTNTKTKEAGSTSESTAPQVNDLASAFNNLAQEARMAGLMVEHARAAIAGDESKLADFESQLAAIDEWEKGMIDSVNAIELGSTSAASAGKKAAGEHKDAWLEAFKEEKDALENLLETDQITQYEYYQRLQELNEKYFGEASGMHEKYIKEYRENEEEIYKGVKEVYDKVRDYLAKAVEQGYEKAINALKKEEKAVLDEIKKQIDALKKEKDKVLKGIKKEIDALKKQKEAVQEYYNKQIDKIKEENEVLQEQNELLEYQQKLQQAKAQRVMVMENGKFTLSENESAVAQAEQALANYQDQVSYEQSIEEIENLRDTQVEALEDQIAALEEYYDYMEEWYDSRIEQMEEYYDQVEENYEKQIEALQNELDAFKEGMQKEEDLENARLAAQVLGMNERADIYAEELENLKNYINEVNKMLESLGEAGATVDFKYDPVTGYHTGIAEVAAVDTSIASRASGDAYFKEDSVALVGESPNAELLLGSKVNTIGGGKLMHLQKGTGVVNAESTSTLAGLLNGLATPQTNVANNRTTQQNFSFGNISLPNVTNAESFVNALSKQFNSYAIQYGNVRK